MEQARSNTTYLIIATVITVACFAIVIPMCMSSSGPSSPNSHQQANNEEPPTEDSSLIKDEETTVIADDTNKLTASKSASGESTISDTGTSSEKNSSEKNEDLPLSGSAEHTALLFITSLKNLDPQSAIKSITAENVSYATIAGICMMLEDGNYTFSSEKPLRQMFANEKSAGYLAQLQTSPINKKSVFSMTLKTDENKQWKITEINLDEFLDSYINQVSDGNIHYTPLIKNPQGGQALAIYFDIDSNTLTERTHTQLKIVAELLKGNADKNLTISGHTDSLGSDNYNLALSKKRALEVKNFLHKQGIPEAQIKVEGFGKAQPRAANTTSDGSDSPAGRRANRRAEILLNF